MSIDRLCQPHSHMRNTPSEIINLQQLASHVSIDYPKLVNIKSAALARDILLLLPPSICSSEHVLLNQGVIGKSYRPTTQSRLLF